MHQPFLLRSEFIAQVVNGPIVGVAPDIDLEYFECIARVNVPILRARTGETVLNVLVRMVLTR